MVGPSDLETAERSNEQARAARWRLQYVVNPRNVRVRTGVGAATERATYQAHNISESIGHVTTANLGVSLNVSRQKS